VFVFPSIYEGFGLPVLEAMASGVPVVAGNNSSIPEVCGSELPLMPDNQSDVWVEEIRALLDSDSLQRARCEKGRQRSQLFTWEATAIKTLDVYREVLSSSI
jgi:alpha-1,3-rhamnosyl/mannosyltransferase